MAKDWPWDKLGETERRMFALVRAYMDHYELWPTNDNGLDAAIKAVAAMTDEEAQALLAMHLLDRTVNK